MPKQLTELIYQARLYLLNYLAFGVLRSIHLTYAHYSRQISYAVAALYNGAMSEAEFVTLFSDIIPAQLTKAWNDGMRTNDLDPESDMLEEWQLQLDAMILSEFDFVDHFAAVIVESRSNPEALRGLLSRGDLWANRYNDVYNESVLQTASGTTKYKWVLGATEEHCQTCAALNGFVAFSREWEQSGFRPQQPPNDLLECGGWRCDCAMEQTTERRSQNALGRLLDIATRKNLSMFEYSPDQPRDDNGQWTSGGGGGGGSSGGGDGGGGGVRHPEAVTDTVDASDIEPFNEITDTEKYEGLVSSMKENGWQGNPVLVYDNGTTQQAITGSHRIYAAREAGIDVPVSKLSFEGAQYEDIQDFLEATDEDQIFGIFKRYDYVESGYITQDQYEIMKEEVHK